MPRNANKKHIFYHLVNFFIGSAQFGAGFAVNYALNDLIHIITNINLTRL